MKDFKHVSRGRYLIIIFFHDRCDVFFGALLPYGETFMKEMMTKLLQVDLKV